MKPFGSPPVRLRPVPALLALLAVLLGILASLGLRENRALPYAGEQLAAARRMAQALDSVASYMEKESIAVQEEDINRTGLIGPQWTWMTTSLGSLEAKRTSLQPDFAALLLRFFHEAGLRPGDAVAVGMSGSFPGLGIAVLSAATQMKLEARVIASYGASMYGATRPELSIVRILKEAGRSGILDYRLLAVSLGGENDLGEGNLLYPDAAERLRRLAQAEGYPLIEARDLAQGTEDRLKRYGGDVRCFVNVGGASVNTGSGAQSLAFPNGLVTKVPFVPENPERGLIFEYAARGIPVIHLLNIRGLAERYGLPYDPSPLPAPGTAGVYGELRVRPAVPLLSLLAAALLLRSAGRPAYTKPRPERIGKEA